MVLYGDGPPGQSRGVESGSAGADAEDPALRLRVRFCILGSLGSHGNCCE